MKKPFYFLAIVCALLSVLVFSADAIHSQQVDNAKTLKDGAWKRASNANQTLLSARLVMSKIGTYYDLNAKEINKGKRMTLGSVIKGAATVTVTYVTGGSTTAVTVLTSIEPTLKMFGLYGSINTQSDLESAYESAISEVMSCISEASQAATNYLHVWDDYRVIVINHNSKYHGSDSSPSDPAHVIEPCEPPKVDTSLTKFRCPGGGCNITYDYPSTAREVHFAKCGTKDDPYDTSLGGCLEVYYTCNISEKDKARHKPNDCGLEKWVRKLGVWSKTPCPGDYRNCTRFVRSHATLIPARNMRSMCLPSESSSSSSSASKSGSISGSSSASAGDSVTVGLTTTTAFSSVYWYVAGPGDSGLGSHVETDTGGSSSTTESFTYTFDSSASGDYVITAYIYNYSDASVYEVSHTVSVSDSSYTVSDDTPNCSDCTSHCSSPCSCTNSGTCNGSVYTPPSTPSTPPSTPSTPPSENCWCDGESVDVTCTKCGATYHICTSQWGDCPDGDGYHYSDYTWQ